MELVSRCPSIRFRIADEARSVVYARADRLENGDKGGHRFLVFRSGIRLTGKAWSVRLSSTTIRGNCVAILYRLLILLIVGVMSGPSLFHAIESGVATVSSQIATFEFPRQQTRNW